MTTVYFASDPHFEHARVLKYCQRLWAGSEGKFYKREDFDPQAPEVRDALRLMNEQLVTRWNSLVKDDDIVYVLGDWAMNAKKAMPYIEQLKGRKRGILGNHDPDLLKKASHLFEFLRDYYVATVDTERGPEKVVLFHFPIEVWDGKFQDPMWLHFHGHSHGSTPPHRKIRGRVDVGVDCWDGFPVTFEQARERALSYTPVTEDHHGS